jgi:8-oxo-dGTP pyrophosphatase MutT (NUDIX family)
MAAPVLRDLTVLDGTQLRELIVTRLQRAPGKPREDWRFGKASPERRAELRRFFPHEPVPAAVLIPLIEHPEGLTVLLTQRAGHLKNHAGQISFPGGRVEASDADIAATALREAAEEIGLAPEAVSVAGYLPDHLIVSGYRVTPVVGFVSPPLDVRIDATEVEAAFEVPLAFFLDPRNHRKRMRRFEGYEVEMTDMPWGERNIWGATAGMLSTFYRMLRGEDL